MYKGKDYNIFICYRGESNSGLLAQNIYFQLSNLQKNDAQHALNPFFAPACIPKGEDFHTAIKSVLPDIKCFIMILDNDFFKNCSEPDDQVYFEIQTALANLNIKFVPVIMKGYNLSNDSYFLSAFDSEAITRIKHVNPINYYSIYDFDITKDLVPVINEAIKTPSVYSSQAKEAVLFDVENFQIQKNRIITFGSYPQTVVSDFELINKMQTGIFSGIIKFDEKPNWLTYNGEKYVSVTENPFNKTKFDNGTGINCGARNFYKVEPLKWRVLFSNDEYLVLMTEKIIDALQFNLSRNFYRIGGETIAPNSWEHSHIRHWLNNDFLCDAFDKSEIEKIVLSEIDNSSKSSYYSSQKSANTTDKVFLISHKEIYLTEYGCAKTTDFARARGAFSCTSSSHEGHGDWWTRSPGNSPISVENIDRRGCVDSIPFCNFVDDTAASVRPVIIIRK